ncbi:glycosyltransferase [Vibrio mimicus]|uniref:glycosyltransferase n=1 Tax=Vibrio mimicus TaxID=674 RepID=UPI0001BAD316|nr:glycosyltransferase [Vibrio mimicus]EEY39696.1 putative glycosyl transferase [Vibrio mimicus MB451]
MKICFLISTYAERARDIKLPIESENISYVIVHQNYYNFINKELYVRKDVVYILSDTIGLSISRNIAIANSNGEISYILDDDVVIDYSSIGYIKDFFKSKKVDVAQFQVSTVNGHFKKYKLNERRLGLLDLAKISSIEIAFRTDFVRKHGILFPEDMGLGTNFPSGEEYVFLAHAYKKNADIIFFPLTTVTHPPVSSGMDFFSNPNKLKAKKIMFSKAHGRILGRLFYIAFLLKKLNIIIKNKAIKNVFLSFN